MDYFRDYGGDGDDDARRIQPGIVITPATAAATVKSNQLYI